MNQYLFIQKHAVTIESSTNYQKAKIKAFKKLNPDITTYVQIIESIHHWRNGHIFKTDLNKHIVHYPSENLKIEYCTNVNDGKDLIDSYLTSIGKF